MHRSFSMASSSSSLCSLSFHSITIIYAWYLHIVHMSIVSLLKHRNLQAIDFIFLKSRWIFGLCGWREYFTNIRANGHALCVKRGRLVRVCARNPRQRKCPSFDKSSPKGFKMTNTGNENYLKRWKILSALT